MEHGLKTGEKLRLEIVAQKPRWFDYMLPWRWHVVRNYHWVTSLKKTGGIKISRVTANSFRLMD